ncbi:hypothetical protein WJX73_010257 [Symbiochloris irregularis]|uniref:Endonuclease/exonuclease/phosphatase domain-containing protein n=1 Tax=Symbiochloris irregularis TaxID=706552 RepID=A0AAW1P9R8_9CHLO
MSADKAALKLLCWNINALVPTLRNIELKHKSLLGFFEHHGADIACFQETKLLPDKLTRELACVKGYESFWAISKSKKGYSGVVTYVSKRWSPVSAQCDCLGSGEGELDSEGRVIITDHGAFVLINVYVPNAGGGKGSDDRPRAAFKLQFMRALRDKVDALHATGKQVILVGDLNIAASKQDVHAGCDYDLMYSLEEKRELQDLLQDLTDTWRLQHPDTENVFTVWDEKTNARFSNRGVRIDYALLSQALLPHLVSSEVVSTPPKWSDHAALELSLKDLEVPAAHPPCALSSSRTFPAQNTIASMFARKRSAPEKGAPAAAEEPDRKHQKTEAAA